MSQLVDKTPAVTTAADSDKDTKASTSTSTGQSEKDNKETAQAKLVEKAKQKKSESQYTHESPKGRFQRTDTKLGVGTVKTVYKAYDTWKGRNVAWTQIDISVLDDKDTDLIIQEVEFLKMMKKIEDVKNCPYLLEMLNIFLMNIKGKQNLVVITKIRSGEELAEFAKDNYPVKLKVFKKHCMQILLGLQVLHSNNIIHRGLNPYIISIKSETGDVLISDFGLSTKRAIAGTKSIKTGHPEYIAPEQYENSKTCTKAVDVYAFGMIVLSYIFAEDPYSECEGAVHKLYQKISQTKEEPECMSALHENLDVVDLIKKCMQWNPDDRPTVDELLQHPFLQPNDDDGKTNAEDLMDLEEDEDEDGKQLTKQEEAEKIIQDTEERIEKVLKTTRQEVLEIVEKAKAEAKKIEEEARSEAGRILAKAELKQQNGPTSSRSAKEKEQKGLVEEYDNRREEIRRDMEATIAADKKRVIEESERKRKERDELLEKELKSIEDQIVGLRKEIADEDKAALAAPVPSLPVPSHEPPPPANVNTMQNNRQNSAPAIMQSEIKTNTNFTNEQQQGVTPKLVSVPLATNSALPITQGTTSVPNTNVNTSASTSVNTNTNSVNNNTNTNRPMKKKADSLISKKFDQYLNDLKSGNKKDLL
eukprot:g2593.t1